MRAYSPMTTKAKQPGASAPTVGKVDAMIVNIALSLAILSVVGFFVGGFIADGGSKMEDIGWAVFLSSIAYMVLFVIVVPLWAIWANNT